MLDAFDFEQGVDLDLGDFNVTVAQVVVELVAASADVPLDSWQVVLQEHDDSRFWGRPVGQFQSRHDYGDPFIFSDVTDGRYEAIARKEGYPSVRQVFEIAPEQKTSNVVLTIPSGTGSISGVVEVGPSGELPSSLMLRSQDERLTVALRLDAEGAFATENLPAGTYAIGRASVVAERTSTLTMFSLKPEEHKVVRVQMDAEDAARADDSYLRVLVVTEASLPLATPDVWLERAGRVVDPLYGTDDTKAFAARPGTYTLHAAYPGFLPVHQKVEIRPREGRTVQEILEPLVVTMRRR
jgi:hypothetical protein